MNGVNNAATLFTLALGLYSSATARRVDLLIGCAVIAVLVWVGAWMLDGPARRWLRLAVASGAFVALVVSSVGGGLEQDAPAFDARSVPSVVAQDEDGRIPDRYPTEVVLAAAGRATLTIRVQSKLDACLVRRVILLATRAGRTIQTEAVKTSRSGKAVTSLMLRPGEYRAVAWPAFSDGNACERGESNRVDIIPYTEDPTPGPRNPGSTRDADTDTTVISGGSPGCAGSMCGESDDVEPSPPPPTPTPEPRDQEQDTKDERKSSRPTPAPTPGCPADVGDC